MKDSFFTSAAVVLILGCVPLCAADAVGAPHAEWAGYYRLATARELAPTPFRQVAPGAKLNDLIIPHLQSWAKARMEATDGVAEDTGGVCLPDGIFRFPNMAGSFLWLPTKDKIVIAFIEQNTAGTRRLYLNAKHPRNLLPTWNGHSVAHWEGDTLVVDSIGFNDKSWLFGGMEPHTEEVHMIERTRMVMDGTFMENEIVVEDRHALTSAYTFKRYYRKQPPGAEMPEQVCAEDPEVWKNWRNERLQKIIDRSKQVTPP